MISCWLSQKDNWPLGKCFYDNSVPEPDLALQEPVLTLTAGSAGEFTFSISPTQLYYDSFRQLVSIITVVRDGKILWEGRIIDEEMDFFKQKKFTCEGALAYFNDTIQFGVSDSSDLRVFLESIISVHNAQCGVGTENAEKHKIFKIGYVSPIVTGITDDPFSIEIGNTTMEVMNSILDRYEGMFYITWDIYGNKSLNFYYEDDPEKDTIFGVAKQDIVFGKNLLDYAHSYDVTELCTAVMPIGGEIEYEEEDEEGNKTTKSKPLTLESLEGDFEGHIEGTGFIMSEEAVATNGWIVKKIDFSEVTDIETLYYLGKAYLERGQFANMEIEISAFDMAHLNSKIDGLPIIEE